MLLLGLRVGGRVGGLGLGLAASTGSMLHCNSTKVMRANFSCAG